MRGSPRQRSCSASRSGSDHGYKYQVENKVKTQVENKVKNRALRDHDHGRHRANPVHNAGVAVGGPVEVLTDEESRWQMDVNFFSLVTLTREAMPLVDKADGRFVHIGSVAGRVGMAGRTPRASMRSQRSSVIEPGEIKTAIWDKANDTLATSEAQLIGPLRDRYGFMLEKKGRKLR